MNIPIGWLVQRDLKAAADGDAVAEASLELNAKIATVSATLKTKLSDIDGKLNKLLAA